VRDFQALGRPELPLRESAGLRPRDEARRARQVREATHGNPFAGRPLRRRIGRGRADVESYAAATLGAPRWMQRLREIEAAEELHREQLAGAWQSLRQSDGADPARLARAWHTVASRWDFSQVNRLIAQHNEYYPIERDLPMDLRTRDYVTPFGIPFRRRPLDAEWVLERFPAGG
jgi:hypothetical protein